MDFICAANWKMNLSFSQAQEFLLDFNSELNRLTDRPRQTSKDQPLSKDPGGATSGSAQGTSAGVASSNLRSSFCFFPQAVHASLFANQKFLNWGAQDFYFENQGAFTGQNSPEIFKELGANMMLIGHSERRTLFAETDEMIARKISKCQELGLIPMLCIGETLEERKKDLTLKVLKHQIQAAFTAKPKGLIVAYEPVWAIGTGMTASSDDVEQAHAFIKQMLGQDTPVLYGGSVKPDNAAELSSLESVNGFLIGGASLKVESLLAIYNNSVKN